MSKEHIYYLLPFIASMAQQILESNPVMFYENHNKICRYFSEGLKSIRDMDQIEVVKHYDDLSKIDSIILSCIHRSLTKSEILMKGNVSPTNSSSLREDEKLLIYYETIKIIMTKEKIQNRNNLSDYLKNSSFISSLAKAEIKRYEGTFML